MTQTYVRTDAKYLTNKVVIYGVGSIALKALSFLLLPLYTRYLTPADYGVLAVTSTLSTILVIVLPLSLHGALARFYFNTQETIERKRVNGTIWIGMLIFALGATVVLDRAGSVIFPWFFQDVPFDPYIRLTIWSAFLTTFSLLPLTLFRVQERPKPYVLATTIGSLLTIGAIIFFVVPLQLGAYGYVLGVFLSSAVMSILYTMLSVTNVSFLWQPNVLRSALSYSLPLVPHGLASWVLELSDRAVLQRFVPLSDLGLYSLAYQLGGLLNLVASAINYAWGPFVFKIVTERGDAAKANLSRLATYYALTMCLVALGLIAMSRDLLQIMTTTAFHSAFPLMPWIVGGLLFSGLYYVPVSFLFLNQTKVIPIITVTSGLFNVALNLWLVPRMGTLAAAWATFLAYALMLILVWYAAQRVYPIQYEYKRLAQMAIVTLALSTIGGIIQIDSLGVDVVFKGAILLAFPAALMAIGFFTRAEKQTALSFALQMLHRAIPSVDQAK